MNQPTLLALPQVVVRRVIPVSIETAWQAWTEPAQLCGWLGSWDDCEARECSADVRVGGRYRFGMHSDLRGSYHVMSGEYLKISAPYELEFSWNTEREGQGGYVTRNSIVNIRFFEQADGVEVVISHTLLNGAPQCLSHSIGWAQALDALDAYLGSVQPRCEPSREIVVDIDIAAAAEVVFDWLISSGKLEAWFSASASTDVRRGGEYRFAWSKTDGAGRHVRQGRFIDVSPPRRLSYDWYLPACDLQEAQDAPQGERADSLVEWTIEPSAEGCRLRMRHSGWPFGSDFDWDALYEGHSAGWQLFVSNLKSVIERGVDLRSMAESAAR